MKKLEPTLGILTAFLANSHSFKTTIDLVNTQDGKVAVIMEFPNMKSENISIIH
ncbi:hypothetical protein [Chryseobacterium indologenes]|uniref:hypothetical protein n=1 Tax=Chryseobacterium indologenes TaxID=253 RepID=UPI000ADFE4B6